MYSKLYYEQAKWEKFLPNVYSKKFRPGPNWPDRPVFCENYISTTMKVRIMKHKSRDASISMFKFIKVLERSNQPSKHEIYPNSKSVHIFLL